jgi:hypothetical protein
MASCVCCGSRPDDFYHNGVCHHCLRRAASYINHVGDEKVHWGIDTDRCAEYARSHPEIDWNVPNYKMDNVEAYIRSGVTDDYDDTLQYGYPPVCLEVQKYIRSLVLGNSESNAHRVAAEWGFIFKNMAVSWEAVRYSKLIIQGIVEDGVFVEWHGFAPLNGLI